MAILRKIFIVLAIVVVVLVGVGFLLPQTSHVERSITISAPIDSVFVQVNDYRNFNSWSPWYGKDPNANYTFTGADSGVGASMAWDSEMASVGSGSQTIIESVYPKRVQAELFFGEDPNPGIITFDMVELGVTQTQVTWSFDADYGNNPIGRWMGLFMDGMLGPEYEQGLKTLKRKLES